MASFLRSAFKRLPPVARRDQRIARLSRRVKELEKSDRDQTHSSRTPSWPPAEPSFRAMMHSEIRIRGLGRPPQSVIRHGKFHVYDLVRSHGIEIAEQFGRWDDPREIPWVDLPDLVVVKSERGSTARGVIPLRRCDGGRTIITHAGKVLTGEQLSERLVALVEAGRISGRFGAEEFLDEDGTGTRLPMDIKVYTFYGEAPMALLRRVPTHGDLTATFRMVDRDGRDVGDVYSGQPVDQNMELPSRLDEVFETAERLSIALRAPYSRIDFYRIRDRIVFGELTPRPGGPQWFGPEVDAMLGDQWERSTARLGRDLAAGAPPQAQWGPFLENPDDAS